MKKYTKPSIKVLKVESVDIIQTSGLNIGEDFNTGSGSAGTMPKPNVKTLNNVNPFKN